MQIEFPMGYSNFHFVAVFNSARVQPRIFLNNQLSYDLVGSVIINPLIYLADGGLLVLNHVHIDYLLIHVVNTMTKEKL